MFGFGKSNEAVSTIRVNYDGQKAESGLKSLASTVKTIISAYIVKQTISYGIELAKIGAQALAVEKNFSRLAQSHGSSIDEMSKKMKKATMGMIDDSRLMEIATKGLMANIPFEDIITGLEYVSKYSIATGTDIDNNLNSLMMSFARNTSRFLEGMGLNIKNADDKVGAAIIQMKQKMGELVISEDDVIVKSKQLTVTFEEQKELIGKALVPVYNSFLDTLNKGLPTLGNWLVNLVRINRAMFTSYTIENMATERLIEQAKATKNVNVIFEERGKVLQKINDIEKENIELTKKKDSTPSEKGAATITSKIIANQAKINSLKYDEILLTKAMQDLSDKPKGKEPPREIAKKEEKEEKEKKSDIGEIKDWRDHYRKLGEVTSEEYDEILKIKSDYLNRGKTEEEILHKETLALYEEKKNQYPQLEEEINALIEAENKRHNKAIIDSDKELLQERIDTAEQMISSIDTINGAMMQMLDARTENQIKQLDKLNLSEEEYEKRKTQIMEEATANRRAFARVQQGIAIAEAIVNVYKAATGSFAETTGGTITRALAMFAAIAVGMSQVAVIEMQQFQTGRIGKKKRSRQGDSINAMIGEGETIVPAPQSAAHDEELRAIVNNTANTAAGMRKIQGATVINNYYGLSTEQVLQAQTAINRRGAVRRI